MKIADRLQAMVLEEAEGMRRQSDAIALRLADIASAIDLECEQIKKDCECSISARNARYKAQAEWMDGVRTTENQEDERKRDQLIASLDRLVGSLDTLQVSVSAGEPVLPPSPKLIEPVINTDNVVDPPRLTFSNGEDSVSQ